MAHRTTFFFFVALVVVASMLTNQVEGRYLPTRSDSDRLDKLRELLRELMDNGAEIYPESRMRSENKLFYKREIPTQQSD